MPRFSIVITSYNSAAFIREAVDSVLAQPGNDFETIVVDDASLDSSREILKEFGQSIKLIQLGTNGGAATARNLGTAMATGDYLVFLDGDDRLLPWALNVYRRIIDLKDPTVILCKMIPFRGTYSSLDVGTSPTELAVVDYESFMKKDRPYRASASAMVMKREAVQKVGGFSQEVWPIEDADLMLKVGSAGRAVSIVSPQTIAYRLHENNASRQYLKLIDGVHTMIRKEKANQYPGGRKHRAERYAVLGGISFAWLKRTIRERVYGRFFKLLWAAWLMVGTAIAYRAIAMIRGRRPVEMIPMTGA